MHVDLNMVGKISGPTLARTEEPLISLALYRLSYRAEIDIFLCPIIIHVVLYDVIF